LDLELIVAAVASLRELGVEEIHLYTPYIVGARSDRKFEEGGNNYIKDVIAPVINSLEFKTVTCIDPHSDVLEACIKGFKKEDNLELLEFAAQSLECFNAENQNFIFISPDAGATKKIYKIAEKIGYKGDIITCSKDRDVDGKLTKTIVPVTFEQLKSEKDFIIIDDICDGGATFINIAKTIKDERQSSKIYLIVTHGIFSKGLKELSQYFDGIYTTNSYRTNNTDNEFVMHNEKYMHILKQLNVF
jgi:ribose-phosphate pyrophosphokinase